MFSPLDLIVENIRGIAIRVEALEARPLIAVKPTSAPEEEKKVTIDAVKSPSMAEFESKIQKLSSDIQAAKKLIETVMTIKIASHIARIEERILAKIDTKINLAIEQALTKNATIAHYVAPAPVVANAITSESHAIPAPIPVDANTVKDIHITIGSHISIDDTLIDIASTDANASNTSNASNGKTSEFEIEFKAKKEKKETKKRAN